MAEPRRALIAGTTGLVGARLLARLLEAPAYAEVHAMVRRPLLDGDRIESRPGERITLALMRPLARWIPARWRPVSADAVARCMLDAGLRSEPRLRVLESDRIQAFAG